MQVSSDRQPASSKSVQTEQSAALEVEVDEQKELNHQLMTRDRHMRQYIQLLQHEVEKRSNEAVVSAARLRELESQLAEILPSETVEPPPSSPPLQQQELEAEPAYKSENILLFGPLTRRDRISQCTPSVRLSVSPSVTRQSYNSLYLKAAVSMKLKAPKIAEQF